jgi:hypothetical protein
MTAEVVVVNFYALRDAAAFDRAVKALVTRMRLFGQPGVKSFRFTGAGPGERRAVVICDDPKAWIDHHDLITSWPEMAALQAAAQLSRIEILGPVTPAIRDWADQFGLGSKVRRQGEEPVRYRR